MAIVEENEVRRNRPEAWRRASAMERIMMLGAAAAVIAAWGLAQWLAPDPRGYGTHEQIGLLPCLTKRLFDLPCMFCGMTTAVTLVVQGDVARGFQTQPAAALGALLAAPFATICAALAAWGKWPAWLFQPPVNRLIWYTGGAVIGMAWLYKLLI